MWHVVYHRKPIDSAIKECFRYQSEVKWKASLVYLFWRFGYILNNYEIREIKLYESTESNIILLSEYRGGRR